MRPLAVVLGIARRTLDLVLLALILVVLAAVVLARVMPMVSGGQTFVVGGASMEPAIPLGAVVVTTPVDAADLEVDDVVSLQVGEEHAVFTHRIVRLVDRDGELWLQTKGDANDKPDPSIVPATAVIGRVTLTVPYAGYLVRLLSTPQGVAFLIALGIFVLAAAWLLESLEQDQRSALRRRAAVADDGRRPAPVHGTGVPG